jgi:hypothetical protein
MAILDNALVRIQDGISSISNEAKGLLGNPTATAVGGAIIGGSLVGATVAAISSRKKSTRKSSAKKRKTTRRKSTRSRRTYKYARTAGKRKDTSTRRIRMTKNGQPYVILKSGKARFISKASARASRKRKGGRY